jgi:hypothetical protein
MKAILELLSKLFSFLLLWKEKKNKEFDIKNTEEFKKVEKKKIEVKTQDENEKLVAKAKDAKAREKALEEIRKKIAK